LLLSSDNCFFVSSYFLAAYLSASVLFSGDLLNIPEKKAPIFLNTLGLFSFSALSFSLAASSTVLLAFSSTFFLSISPLLSSMSGVGKDHLSFCSLLVMSLISFDLVVSSLIWLSVIFVGYRE
jgi:hypothetical protein